MSGGGSDQMKQKVSSAHTEWWRTVLDGVVRKASPKDKWGLNKNLKEVKELTIGEMEREAEIRQEGKQEQRPQGRTALFRRD